jgi:hypothetical protein
MPPSDVDLSKLKTRFYLSLEARLIAWVAVTLTAAGALALPSLALAVASLGGMLVILAIGMRDPVYIQLREMGTVSE